MKQSDIFLAGEGQAWLERNKDKLPPKDDIVLEHMKKWMLRPKHVLEIGCSNGWRLEAINFEFDCACYGIDPAIEKTVNINDNVTLMRGIASNLSAIFSHTIDTLIYGFCLYLCDPEDYFLIATEADRVLQHNGVLIIHDFPRSRFPFKVPYEHKEGVESYHYDFAKLWSWHPFYEVQDASKDETLVILDKDIYR
jgi:ubiquinone/menaquinone biosynthesis C-methylase UbiE